MRLNEYNDVTSDDIHKKRKRRNYWISLGFIVFMSFAGVATWSYYQNKELKDLKIQMNNQYSRAFLDLSNYVDNVEVLLAKSLITSTTLSTSEMFEEVWRQANLAQTNIGQLPISPPVLEKTSNFLTQVGDMAYALNTKTLGGIKLSDKEYKSLQKLHGYAVSLQKNLHGIESQINSGKLSWGALYTGSGKNLSKVKTKNPQTNQFENIEKNFQEYPSLIYDGPYSDHMLKTKPMGLKKDTVTVNQAQDIAKKIIGEDKIKEIKKLGDSETSNIETYRFKVTYNNSEESQDLEIDITKQGGQVYWMLRDRDFDKEKLSMKEAKKVAVEFLNKSGFKNMKDTYYQKSEGAAIICYAYKQDNAIVYPDLIKVKVALDNGEIIGIESKGYLYNHRTRKIPKAKLTIEQARKKINSRLDITNKRLAIIPTDFKTEKYCYEFTGKVDDRTFIVYINAITGAEEDVLMLINTEQGILTI